MPTHHDDIALTAGDDWLIAGTLIDDDGAALDLSAVDTVQWIMLNVDGMPALTPGVALIEIVDPPTDGLVNVLVPSDATKHLLPGRYVDAMRVVMSESSRALVWRGIIGVDANPFDAFDSMVPVPLAVAPEFVGTPEIGVGNLGQIVAPAHLTVGPEIVGAPILGAPNLG